MNESSNFTDDSKSKSIKSYKGANVKYRVLTEQRYFFYFSSSFFFLVSFHYTVARYYIKAKTKD